MTTLAIRTGIGYDSHRLVDGRPLILGGVSIPHERGLTGHSDADALTHAIIDAILGAAAVGDIGCHFPPTDETYLDADSMILLQRTIDIVRKTGFQVVNIDSTIIAEAPKMGPHIATMREAIASAASLSIDMVSVKATTNEGMGFVGRREGIAAMAIATLHLNPSRSNTS